MTFDKQINGTFKSLKIKFKYKQKNYYSIYKASK